MDDVLARFLPQFVTLARTRIASCRAAAVAGDRAAVTTATRDLHTLAGEAGLLGLTAVVPLARDAEVKFKAAATDLPAALDRLAQAIEALAPAPG